MTIVVSPFTVPFIIHQLIALNKQKKCAQPNVITQIEWYQSRLRRQPIGKSYRVFENCKRRESLGDLEQEIPGKGLRIIHNIEKQWKRYENEVLTSYMPAKFVYTTTRIRKG